jgi:transcriptional regulator with XRE-family HTH domain
MVATAHDLNRERHWVCARRMCERRHDLGLTQSDVVGRLAGLGAAATNRTLSAMEHGQGVDVGRLPEIAVALDCTVTYLLGLTDQPRSWVPDDGPDQPSADRARPTTASVPRSNGETAPPTNGNGNGNGQAHLGWILGPEIPDRRTSAVPDERRA